MGTTEHGDRRMRPTWRRQALCIGFLLGLIGFGVPMYLITGAPNPMNLLNLVRGNNVNDNNAVYDNNAVFETSLGSRIGLLVSFSPNIPSQHRREIVWAISHNVLNPAIGEMVVAYDSSSSIDNCDTLLRDVAAHGTAIDPQEWAAAAAKWKCIHHGDGTPSYFDLFRTLGSTLTSKVGVLANADIVFDKTLAKLAQIAPMRFVASRTFYVAVLANTAGQ